jgi:hypothetical protein
MLDASGPALTALAQMRQGADRLAPGEREQFRRHLDTIARSLRGPTAASPAAVPRARPAPRLGGGGDPYARLLPGHGGTARALGTPLDLQQELGSGQVPNSAGDSGQPAPTVASQPSAPRPAPAPLPPPATSTIGARAADALEAVAFTDFVAGLVRGTFQAIVDATAQQMREYAELVASISRSAEEFTRDNVSDDQTRLWLANRHPADLYVAVPPPGKGGAPQVRVQPGSVGQSPEWLSRYNAAGQELSDEVAEGVLLPAARQQLGEERLQHLATMVLMGVNRVVVKDGRINAKLQFHASASDRSSAALAVENRAQQGSIAQRQTGLEAGVTTMVSTTKANAQADAAIRADLMGEVQIRFATETFNLNNFADGQAMALISQHARWRGDAPGTTPAAPAATPPAEPRDG